MGKIKRAVFFVGLALTLFMWVNVQSRVGNAQGGSGERRRTYVPKSILPANSKTTTKPKTITKPTTTKSYRSNKSNFTRSVRSIRSERRAAAARAAREEYESIREAERIAAAERATQEEVWQVAIIRNTTKGPIPYQSKHNGEWHTYTLQPGEGRIYSSTNTIKVRFDSSYAEGSQTKEYCLASSIVRGHEPTDTEKQEAQVNHFALDSNNNIELYQVKK